MANDYPSDELREAAVWLERIQSSSSSADEFQAWHDWLAESADHPAAFARVREFWRAAGELSAPGWPTEDDLRSDEYDGTESIDEWHRRMQLHTSLGMLAWLRRHCTWPWPWPRRSRRRV